MIKKLSISLFCLVFALNLNAQEPDKDPSSFLYRKEYIGNMGIHTAGIDFGFRYGKQKSYDLKRLLVVDFVTMKHSKETKTFNLNSEDAKGYVYGKLNGFGILRLHAGRRKILYQKKRDRGVEIGYNATGGLSLGLLKPIYLEVCTASGSASDGCVKGTAKYDPDLHFRENIFGRASVTRGFSEIRVMPGLSAKAGMYFEKSIMDDNFKAVEIGGAVDFFFQKVPIMNIENNKQLFLTLYVNLLFGKKYF